MLLAVEFSRRIVSYFSTPSRHANNKVIALSLPYCDNCEKNPRKFSLTFLCQCFVGGLAIAVPGEVRGMYQAWKDHGNLPWKDLVQPTINITLRGFQVPQRMHEAAHVWRYHVESDPGLRYVKKDPHGILYSC